MKNRKNDRELYMFYENFKKKYRIKQIEWILDLCLNQKKNKNGKFHKKIIQKREKT